MPQRRKNKYNLDYFGLETEPNHLRLGWRIYNDFGTAFAEHRAAYKGTGAAAA